MQLGFRSSFNFIPEGSYSVPASASLLAHRPRLRSRRPRPPSRRQTVSAPATPSGSTPRRSTSYLDDWNAVGFRSGFMFRQLDWLHDLDIQYDCSTFDTDPFEPQPDGVGTIFPFWVPQQRPQDYETTRPPDHQTTGPEDHRPVVPPSDPVAPGSRSPVVPWSRGPSPSPLPRLPRIALHSPPGLDPVPLAPRILPRHLDQKTRLDRRPRRYGVARYASGLHGLWRKPDPREVIRRNVCGFSETRTNALRGKPRGTRCQEMSRVMCAA